jgi:HK97 gp10 family phage protein
MAGFSISLQGFKELGIKLTALVGDAGLNAERDGLRAGGEVIQAAIRSRAPVRPDLPSGTALPPGALSHDIELHVGKEDGKWSAIVRPGTETAYAAEFVEYGHRMVTGGYSKVLRSGPGWELTRGRGRLVKTSGGSTSVPAQPFIRPGFEEATGAAVDAATKVTGAAIEKAFGK